MQVIQARATSIGSLPVQRVLPFRERRAVGPFVFLDEMGPIAFPPGEGLDVPPHPHIGLSTLTYMLEGEMDHRDSLGVHQAVRPGAVNWMTCGHGVTHSERSDPSQRARGHRIHGIQIWVALPPDRTAVEPSFEHHPEASIPTVDLGGKAHARVIAGEAFGARSPVSVYSPLFYADVTWSGDSTVSLDPELGERAIYPLAGELRVDGQVIERGSLAAVADGTAAEVTGSRGARALVLGGAPLPAPIFMHWNYVAYSKDEIEAAKSRWANGAFPPDGRGVLTVRSPALRRD